MEKVIRVRQRRGTQQTEKRQKATLRALGLRKIGAVNFISDSKPVRGMLNAVQHMIDVELVDASAKKAKKADRRGYKLG